jgi:Ni,Fe-hydrogenase III small subunit
VLGRFGAVYLSSNPHSADVIHVTGIFEKSNPSNFFSLTFLTLVSTFCEN